MSLITALPKHIEKENIIKLLCSEIGLIYKHNQTSINSKDGYHRYVILDPSISDSVSKSITSKNCIFYSEARFSRYSKPSVLGECLALNEVKQFLETKIKQKYKYLQDKLNEYQC